VSNRQHFHRILERLLETNLRVLLLTSRPEDLPQNVTHLLEVEDCRVIASGPRRTVLSASHKPTRRKKNRQLSLVTASLGGMDGALPQQFVSRTAKANTAAPRALVELRDVTVRYGATTILNRVSWTLREGESWALLGPNGSGKTTLLSLIQGDNPQAYTNQVIVFGRRRGTGESIWQLKKQIGWVSPELQLHFDDQLSVIDAVLSGFYDTIGVFEEMTARQLAAARRWLGRFDLKQYAFAPLFSLSAGLQRMTLLARALVKQPRLLILDEPCQGLDPVHRDLIVNQVDRLIRAGSVSAIFVTHRLEEIPASIELVLRLSKGQSAQMSATPNRRESKSEGIAEPGLPS
jgi:molybdate transport system ATP-binding protein